MRKIFYFIISINLYTFSLSAQQQFQVRRIINCYDKFEKDVFGVAHDEGLLSDSPNRRFMSIERELQKTLIDWVQENRIQAYHYTDTMADFSKKMDKQTLLNKLRYYDKFVQDSAIFYADDLQEIGIEEIVRYENGHFTYQIQAIILYIPQIDAELSFRKREAIARFDYKELAKLWEKTYKKSLRKKSYGAIQSLVQLYDDNFKTVSFTEAFEKRYFNAQIETIIPNDKHKILDKEVKYQPQNIQIDSIWYLPQFSENKRGRIKTSIYETIDLRKEAEFFKDSNALVKVLMQGIKEDKITPYYFDTNLDYTQHFKKKNLMPKQNVERQLTYFDEQFGDTTTLVYTDLFMIEVHSIVKIRRRKKVDFQPYKISLLIPEGTNSSTMMGYFRITILEYRQVAKYLKKMAKKSDEFTFNTQTKNINFAKALSQRNFAGIIRKYDNFFDKTLEGLYFYRIGHYYSIYHSEDEERLRKQSKFIIEYIKSLGR